MRIAVMQPYFLPYFGHFQMMSLVDKWLVLDQTQFVHKGWINRNRVLHSDPRHDWYYLSVPVKAKHQKSKISELEIAPSDWRSTIRGRLVHYRAAPGYAEVMKMVDSILENKARSLSSFVTASLRIIAQELGLKTEITRVPDQYFEGWSAKDPSDWALRVAKMESACAYVNPISGAQLFRVNEFRSLGVKLELHCTTPLKYPQGRERFIPNLSILDPLMWQGFDKVRSWLMVR